MKRNTIPSDDGDVMVGRTWRQTRAAGLEPTERPEWSRKALLAFHGLLLLVFVGGGWMIFAQLTAEPSSPPTDVAASTQDGSGAVADVPSPTLSPTKAVHAADVPLALDAR